MGRLLGVFGTNKKEIWRQLADQLDGQFTEQGLLKRGKVTARVTPWTVTFDTFSRHAGNTSIPFTRLRAPYLNKDGFRFELHRASVFSGIGKMLGMQDIEIGQSPFDDDFIIKANNDYQIRRLLKNPKLRGLIAAQPKIRLRIKDDEGWFGQDFPEAVDELYFESRGVIKDLERLRLLYDLFAETLNTLCHIGSAYQDDPHIHL